MSASMTARLLSAIVFVVLMLAIVAAKPPPASGLCAGYGRDLVVDVNVTLNHVAVRRVDDSGVWALGRHFARITMWETEQNAYCARVAARGVFHTLAGVSPNGTGTVPGGLTGLTSSDSFMLLKDAEGGFTTDYSKAKGSAGEWDCLGMDLSECASDGIGTSFFEWGVAFSARHFRESYRTQHNGRLLWQDTGVIGDITG
jgi:hypothetical protein